MNLNFVVGLLALTVCHTALFAQTVEDRVKQLEAQIRAMQLEVEQIKKAPATGDPFAGLQKKPESGLNFRFYGESKYKWTKGADGNYFDPNRFVLIPSFKVNDWIIFNSEIEIEHGGAQGDSTGRFFNGELEIEQFYADFLLSKHFNIRSPGISLIPMGRVNQRHEPTTFYSVDRPRLYQEIIPSTWMEGSLGGVWGNIGEGLKYETLVSTGITERTSNFITGDAGMRKARPRLYNKDDTTDELGYSAKLTYTGIPGLEASASGYVTEFGGSLDRSVTAGAWDVEASYRPRWAKRLELRGDFAMWHFGNKENLSANNDASTTNDVGNRMYGWYAEAAYDVWPESWRHGKGSAMRLVPFVRYADIHTTSGTYASGLTKTYSSNKDYLTGGFAWFLSDHVVLKSDYTACLSKNSDSIFSIGIGFDF